jgi:hypothetical protein
MNRTLIFGREPPGLVDIASRFHEPEGLRAGIGLAAGEAASPATNSVFCLLPESRDLVVGEPIWTVSPPWCPKSNPTVDYSSSARTTPSLSGSSLFAWRRNDARAR